MTDGAAEMAERALSADGQGCHAGRDKMLEAAGAAGQAPLLEAFAKDYPQGPHDKPQSMCPAFGSLRVGLRMRRVGTLLSGSACCVFGLSFVSHFYGARRSVGYVPFNSETLVTGKLFEDIRDAVHAMADPDRYDAIVVTNLCVPTASGVPLRLLPREIDGVRIIGIDVPGFGVPTHAEAKDVLASAMLAYARSEVEAGPVAAPAAARGDRPTVALLGEMFPVDPVTIGQLIAPLGLAVGPTVPCREWREQYAALDASLVAAIHPFYTATVREFTAIGRPIVASAPVGVEGTAAWLDAVAEVIGAPRAARAAAHAVLPKIKEAFAAAPVKGRITLSGYEGSELIVARLLIESGAEVPYVGTACAKSERSAADADWLRDRGVEVRFRASLEDDCAAVDALKPDLAIGTTPVVQHAKEQAIPALYFTNLVSARPLMGHAGAGPLQQIVTAAMANRARMNRMRDFFAGVGAGDTAGVWEGQPNLQPEFRARHAKKLEKQRRAQKAQEMI
ncbi:MAG: chlorophyllide a reductase subunit Y [Pseudomonadota bacterium]